MPPDPDLQARIRRFEDRYAENPDSLVFVRLADLHREAGDPDRALEVVREGLRRHPDYASGHLVRGRCLKALGEREEAETAFRRVLELDGGNPVALRSLADLAVDRGDPGDARGHLREILDADPGNESAREMLRSLADGAGDGPPGDEGPDSPPGETDGDRSPAFGSADAEELRARVEELGREIERGEGPEATDSELATETLAGLYQAQGLYREAVEMYERLLERRPDDEDLRRRLRRARAALEAEGDATPEPPRGPEGAATAREQLRALLRGEATPATGPGGPEVQGSGG